MAKRTQLVYISSSCSMSATCIRTYQSRILCKPIVDVVRPLNPSVVVVVVVVVSIKNAYTELLEPDPDPTTDFARMARFLTGTAIGLVLGGGGARGCAHVGMIQAMHEAGIPIDLIGGTSIGAFMGALWADELNIKGYVDRARDWCKVMFSRVDEIQHVTLVYD
jgi:predicted acylesterase/phospholipase RssA